MKNSKWIITGSAFLLASCASTPDVTLKYYLATSTHKWSVTQTASCTKDKRVLLKNDLVIDKVIYESDMSPNTPAYAISLKNLDKWYTNGDSSIEFYDDGRLKGFNSSQTGVGQAAIKSVLALASAAGGKLDSDTYCDDLAALSGDQPLSVKHSITIDDSNFDPYSAGPYRTYSFTMERENFKDEGQFSKLAPIFGDEVTVSVTLERQDPVCQTAPTIPSSGIPHCGTVPIPTDELPLVLRQPAIAKVSIVAGPSGKQDKFTFQAPVPQRGILYTLPIKKPPFFGANRFELAIAESGAISKLKYGKDSGFSSVTGTLTDIRTETDEDTAVEKAAALKAEADVIAQQQRLQRCESNPETCI